MDRGGENCLRAIRLAFKSLTALALIRYYGEWVCIRVFYLVIKMVAHIPKTVVNRGGLKIFV